LDGEDKKEKRSGPVIGATRECKEDSKMEYPHLFDTPTSES
jgi:hypothetical protein